MDRWMERGMEGEIDRQIKYNVPWLQCCSLTAKVPLQNKATYQTSLSYWNDLKTHKLERKWRFTNLQEIYLAWKELINLFF